MSRFLVLALSMLLTGACADATHAPQNPATASPAASQQRPLAGSALEARAGELATARETLGEMQTTLRGLQRRENRKAVPAFEDFVRAYFGLHLDPLLRPEWPSRHPDLMTMDATLRFARADLMRRLQDSQEFERALADIERRFTGRQEMLIEYPLGQERTVRSAVQMLRGRSRWTF